MTRKPIRVSASRIKTLDTCTMTFWYQEVLRLPSPVHHRTTQGKGLHGVLEHLLQPKRRVALRAMLESPFKLADWPSIQRYFRFYDHRYGMAPFTMEDMESMLSVALLGLRPHCFDAQGQWSPPPTILIEHKFKMMVGVAEIAGVFDLLLLWPDRAVVVDYKSQRTKFTKAEVPHLIQARLYQLATYREFGLIPPVEFILLRHAPTERTPDKHLQRTPPAHPATLLGLETYVKAMHERFNSFTEQDAYSNPCTDHGTCEYRCSYLRPYSYWVVCGAEDPTGLYPKSSHMSVDLATQSKDTGDIVLERRHPGCVLRWRRDNR